jgi:hypothetical protein
MMIADRGSPESAQLRAAARQKLRKLVILAWTG